ncbi:MAG TPA: hypothetical protein VGA98_09870, partial [Allosphingosinicella sp.]
LRRPGESRDLVETRRDFSSWDPGFRRDDGYDRRSRGQPKAMKGGLALSVVPAKAGISWRLAETSRPEVPAFAGMTAMTVAPAVSPRR